MTKETGQHLLIETNIDIHGKTQKLKCYIKYISEIVQLSQYE